jgi:crotonobetainyl-CoA:carnitine CoA-transferase CaiB-like acyl-CoA transferase
MTTMTLDDDVRMSGPLDGVRVIDTTSARSGPTCSRQLADLGADVIQVGRGRPSLPGSDDWNLNRNKRSITLELKDREDLDVLLRLVKDSDVFLENWRPSVKDRLGLSPERLLADNPRLIYGSISGFGQDGPYADRPGVDQIAQGMGGLMAVTGPPGTGPWRVGVAVSDLVAGTFLAQGVLAALFARERTGRGQWVHTSLLEAAVNLLDFQAARWLIDHVDPVQEGNNHPTIPAMGTFITADGVINVGILDGFPRFAALVGRPDLADDPRFATHRGRVEHRDDVNAEVSAALRTRTTAEWLELFAEVFPAGPVYRVSEVFADPQVRHLALTERVTAPDGRPIEVLRHPVNFSATPASVRSGAPAPGEHTAEVLAGRAADVRQAPGVVSTVTPMETSDHEEPHAEPVALTSYSTAGEAEIAQAKLRAFGIEAEIEDQVEGGLVLVEGEPGIVLQVRAADADEAKRILFESAEPIDEPAGPSA